MTTQAGPAVDAAEGGVRGGATGAEGGPAGDGTGNGVDDGAASAPVNTGTHGIGLAAAWPARTAVAVLFLMLLVVAFGAGRALAPPVPADSSADAGFARDMQIHHAQAVEMSLLIRDRTTDPELRAFAYDSALTQQHQIGQMYGWLDQWGLPQAGPVMTWMHAAGQAVHHSTTPQAGTPGAATTAPAAGRQGASLPSSAMPGMASAADLRKLERLSGRDAEILYLQLMIVHHRGGVEMAQALLDRGALPVVERLARAIVVSQNSDITAMERMLRERGEA